MKCPSLLALTLLIACGGADEARPIDAPPGGDVDAATIDGGVAGPDAAEYGVRCGDQQELCVPGSSQGCCEDADAGTACEPLGGLCLDRLTSCDGPEDCMTAGDVCCDFGFGPSCTEPSNCTTKGGGTTICHGDDHCPNDAPTCCDGVCAATCD
jgi:hypothetical protein